MLAGFAGGVPKELERFAVIEAMAEKSRICLEAQSSP